jgi:hypothetical protein
LVVRPLDLQVTDLAAGLVEVDADLDTRICTGICHDWYRLLRIWFTGSG